VIQKSHCEPHNTSEWIGTTNENRITLRTQLLA